MRSFAEHPSVRGDGVVHGLLPALILGAIMTLSGGCLEKGLHTPSSTGESFGWPLPILPESIGTFRLSEEEPPALFTADTLWEHLNGGAHQYIQTGFEQLLLVWYQGPDAEQRVMVEIFLMKSPEAADIIFNQQIYGNGEKGDLCGQSYAQGNFFFFQKDRCYVRLTAYYYDDLTMERLKAISGEICNVLSDHYGRE